MLGKIVDPQPSGLPSCAAYWSRMKSTEEIDAWGFARACGCEVTTALLFLEELVARDKAYCDGKWYGRAP